MRWLAALLAAGVALGAAAADWVIVSSGTRIAVAEDFDLLVIAPEGEAPPQIGQTDQDDGQQRFLIPGVVAEDVQVLEYLRAFLVIRLGLKALRGVTLLYGAVGLYARDRHVGAGKQVCCIGIAQTLAHRPTPSK